MQGREILCWEGMCGGAVCVRNDLKEKTTKSEGGDVSAHRGPFYYFYSRAWINFLYSLASLGTCQV